MDMSFLELVEGKGYMSGSALWNADESSDFTHIRRGVHIGTRLSSTLVQGAPAQYGILRIDSADKDAVTFTYQPYSAAGGIPMSSETWTVQTYDRDIAESPSDPKYWADINHDGTPDIYWTLMDTYRAGIPTDSRYLRFIAKKNEPTGLAQAQTTHAAMFSLLKEQYPGANYPHGLTGINPSGAWIYWLRRIGGGFIMHDGTNIVKDISLDVLTGEGSAETVQASLSKAAVGDAENGTYWYIEERAETVAASAYTNTVSLVKGDYVIDNMTGDYYYYKGAPDTGLHVSDMSNWIKLNARNEPPEGNFGAPYEDTASDAEIAYAFTQDSARFSRADFPYFASADASDPEFIAFKINLLDEFDPDYNPDGARYAPDSASLDGVIAFLNAAIYDGDVLSHIEDTSGVDIPDQTEDYCAFIYRHIVTNALNMPYRRYVLKPEPNPTDISAALPEASLVIRHIDRGNAPASSVSPARAGSDADYVPQYADYISKRDSARAEFEKEFYNVIEKDIVQTILAVIGTKYLYDNKQNIIPDVAKETFVHDLGNMKSLVAVGLAGGGQFTGSKVEITVGAAVFLQMEIDTSVEVNIPNLFGKDGITLYNYNSVFSAGPVVLQIQMPIKFNLDISVTPEPSTSLFAGYTGFYGGKATAGLNYGVNWKRICVWPWPKYYIEIPWGFYANPYENHSVYNTTLAYAGYKTKNETFSVNVGLTVKPYLAIEPGFGAYGIIWARLPCSVGLPVTLTAKENFRKFNLRGDMEFEVDLEVGVGIKILIFDFYEGLYDTALYKKTIALFDWDI
jgi:hypothetical protein